MQSIPPADAVKPSVNADPKSFDIGKTLKRVYPQ
jgi:hypothetical protein